MTASVLRLAAAACLAAAFASSATAAPEERNGRVEELLSQMTLEEKAGQLNFVSIVPVLEPAYEDVTRRIAEGSVGGLFNVYGAEQTRTLQEIAVTRTRLKIPMILAMDVIHGYRTVFPTPLAQAASWDLAAIETAERVATVESTAAGVNMIFTPMLDVSRDPRWGRVVEGAGESPWLAARIGEARVRGIQGADLKKPDNAASCVKHFGANGAVEGGRDYSALDLSPRALKATYLPPFEAASRAGVRCFMGAFNATDGRPTITNRHLLTDVLRGEWGFTGVVTSDFQAIKELPDHGTAADLADSARQALTAGADLDMESRAYVKEIPELVRTGRLDVAVVDEAVRRVLRLKEDLGLFEDPYRGATPDREKREIFTDAQKAAAQDMAEKSFVLLKNDGVLPFGPDVKRVALIGPLGDSAADTLGPWAARGEPNETETLKQGLERRLGEGGEVLATHGGAVEDSTDEEIAAAVETARRSQAVVLAVGERFNQSGESAARSELGLPGHQEKLVRAVLAAGKPTVVVVFAGRPLALSSLAERAPAILYAWQPGTMGGPALARLLMGDVEPKGRLPMTFPRSVGQIPIHHEALPTGRPAETPIKPFTTGYGDSTYAALYPFGYGLTYTSFTFGPPKLDRERLAKGESATVSVAVRNHGRRDGEAVVQLYLRPKVAEVSQPMRALRGFARVALKAGETKTVELTVAEKDFGYWKSETDFGATAGPIDVMTGPDAANVQTTTLTYAP
ncbi:beta-glucosidase BglX [Methylopila henanensis]|uniref:beta-glucosidase n=1 Tax=Methylopila henanensis TaxID=873516 RepID=A0ABW4K8I2_9HYPH